jgi:hypothetical protein
MTMSTRSVIGTVAGDTWRGRYCHSDGYPSHQLTEILALVRRDGVDKVLKTITEDYYGWSFLTHTAAASDELPPSQQDGRFVKVEGYGTAYTTVRNQSAPDDWITADGDTGGAVYAYVLTRKDVIVYEREYDPDVWALRGRVSYAVEVGEALFDSLRAEVTA